MRNHKGLGAPPRSKRAPRGAGLLVMTAVTLLCLSPSGGEARRPLPSALDLDAEYRVQTTHIEPLDLNGVTAERFQVTQQRLRVEPGLRVDDVGVIRAQLDILSGALFGDNGDFNQAPQPTSGLSLSSRWPNAAGWTIGLPEGADGLDPDSYRPVLTTIEPIRVNRVWAEVNLPFGLLSVGRQPATRGGGISLHDGSRVNRWGVSRYSGTADRFLFATKVSEAFRMMTADDYTPDRSTDDGVFLAAAYDMATQDDVILASDDLHQTSGTLQWKAKAPRWFGWDWRDFLFQATFARRFGDEFGTEAFGVPVTLEFTAGRVHFLGEFMAAFGHTTEISEGLAALREVDEARRVIKDQDILMFGARALLDLELGPVVATLEFDYASGDDDPRDDTAQTTFSFARDRNVGLLLFEHVLAYETARSAAVGVQNLKEMGANSFPITELESEGRFHNGIVIFPQLLYTPVNSAHYGRFHVRTGALIAWAAQPVIDPIMTLLSEDGLEIKDDAVNWNGGEPARFYGTELDLQLEWTYREFFTWTVEGAVLFPGDALHDESGDAVNSFLIENRFTYVF
ncbi:hypothetical protein KKB55_10930 [Myxococcota bacterium]|nr:hypothetical protein [Myxococcota bacterium]